MENMACSVADASPHVVTVDVPVSVRIAEVSALRLAGDDSPPEEILGGNGYESRSETASSGA